MADHITITKAAGKWVVRADGAILGETVDALELREGEYPPVFYIPREDIAMDFLDRSPTTSHCPHKGDASYYSISAESGPITDAAWSYESPFEAVKAIKDHLAFYPDKVTLESV